MATPETTQHSALQESLNNLLGFDPTQLVRAEALGLELSFANGLTLFQNIANLARQLRACDLSGVPIEKMREVGDVANEIRSTYAQIMGFSSKQAGAEAARNNLLENLRNQWNRFYTASIPLIAYYTATSQEAAALTSQVRQTLSDQQKDAAAFSGTREKMLAELESTLVQVRKGAAESGVTQHAKYFQDEAKYHQRIAFSWLFATLVIALATIAYAVFGVTQVADNSEPTLARVIASLAPRLVVLFVFSFALVTASRNYAASRHNFIVNRHRQNALSSFESFVKGASDAQTRDAVLVQATQSIFAPQDTGWTKNDPPPTPASQIVEIVRGVTKAGGEKSD